MPTAISVEPVIEPRVREVLRRHNAEAAFQTACDIARSCFLAMGTLRVDVLDDPDEENRVWVVLHIQVPASYRWETLHEEELRFHKAMLTQIPLDLNPLFGLHMDYSPD